MAKAQKLDELERQIKELENDIGSETASSDYDEEAEDDEHSSEDKELKPAQTKKRQRVSSTSESSSSEADELLPIPPLPKDLIPAPGLLLSAGARRRTEEHANSLKPEGYEEKD